MWNRLEQESGNHTQNEVQVREKGSSLGSRNLGLAIMLIGAAGLVAAVVAYESQVLCLLGSTLVTFAGLAMRWAAGKNASAGADDPSHWTQVDRPSAAPATRRAPVLSEGKFRPLPPPPQPLEKDALAEDPIPLIQRVMDTLYALDAGVVVDTEREDRSILTVQSSEGKLYTVLVRSSSDPVEVSDLRALSALVTSAGTEGGYFISGGPFSPEAYEWASARGIRLVQDDELDELGV